MSTVWLFLLLYVHAVKFGRDSLLEMAHSVHLPPDDVYVAFGCTDLKCSCDPTDSVPRLFDRVYNIVWYRVDVYASLGDPVSFTFNHAIWANL